MNNNNNNNRIDLEIFKQFPDWSKVENMKQINNLCLSDDIDSLFSCIILQRLFPNLKITRFYDFNSLYMNNKIDVKESCIGVDIDLINGKCWGNHVTLNTNNQSANINRIMNINSSNYTQKFCGSTLLQIIGYYNLKVDNLSELQKAILLTIDSTFLGYYFNNGYYCKKYLSDMGLDCLLKVLEEHSKQDFKELDDKYKLNKSKIWIENGKLETDIHIAELEDIFKTKFNLPTITFEEYRKFELYTGEINNTDNIFSCAMTYKNMYMYSTIE